MLCAISIAILLVSLIVLVPLKPQIAYADSIDPPTVTIEMMSDDSQIYSVSENKFMASATWSHSDSSAGVWEATGYSWAYKKADESDSSYVALISNSTNTHTFGKHISSGDYVLRVAVEMVISKNGHITTITGYGTTNFRVSGDAEFEILDFTVVGYYGDKIGDLHLGNGQNGVWHLDQSIDKTQVLSAGKHGLKARFVPNDTNYAVVDNYDLKIEIIPFTTKVVVLNSLSVMGQPLSKIDYVLASSAKLKNGDSIQDLGIEMTKEEGFEPGEYRVYGSASNQNYNVIFLSEDNPNGNMDVGGKYTILPDKINSILQSGIQIEAINTTHGFDGDTTLRMEQIHFEFDKETTNSTGEYSLGAYKLFKVVDDIDYFIDDNTTIKMSYLKQNIQKVYAIQNGKMQEVEVIDGECTFLADGLESIVFVGIGDIVVAETDFSVTSLILTIFAGLAFLIDIILIVAVTKRRKR